jgi:alpha-beta hydrolase superfamily lysophospholipase
MANASRFQPPLLQLHGDADRLVNVQASRDFFAAVSHKQKKIHIYEGGYHEPHNDNQHDQVAQDIAAWLEKQLMVMD